MSRQFEFLKDSKAKLSVVKNNLFKDELRRHCLINGGLAIEGDDGTDCKSMLPFDDHSITDEGSRCDFIA